MPAVPKQPKKAPAPPKAEPKAEPTPPKPAPVPLVPTPERGVTVFFAHGGEMIDILQRGFSTAITGYEFHVISDESNIPAAGKLLVFGSSSSRPDLDYMGNFDSKEQFERLKARGNVMFVIGRFSLADIDPVFGVTIFGGAPFVQITYFNNVAVFDKSLPNVQHAIREISEFLQVPAPSPEKKKAGLKPVRAAA